VAQLENDAVNAALKGTQKSLYELIAKQKGLRVEDLMVILSKNRRTIQRNIKVLTDKGLLVRVGSDKTGHWEVKKY
jgi:ATP-dependent DNA helicase RecG